MAVIFTELGRSKIAGLTQIDTGVDTFQTDNYVLVLCVQGW